jgi:hypothetical protein
LALAARVVVEASPATRAKVIFFIRNLLLGWVRRLDRPVCT